MQLFCYSPFSVYTHAYCKVNLETSSKTIFLLISEKGDKMSWPIRFEGFNEIV